MHNSTIQGTFLPSQTNTFLRKRLMNMQSELEIQIFSLKEQPASQKGNIAVFLKTNLVSNEILQNPSCMLSFSGKKSITKNCCKCCCDLANKRKTLIWCYWVGHFPSSSFLHRVMTRKVPRIQSQQFQDDNDLVHKNSDNQR